MDLSINLNNVFRDADKINGNSNANSVSCLWNELVRGNTFYRLLTPIPVSSHEGCIFSRSLRRGYYTFAYFRHNLYVLNLMPQVSEGNECM